MSEGSYCGDTEYSEEVEVIEPHKKDSIEESIRELSEEVLKGRQTSLVIIDFEEDVIHEDKINKLVNQIKEITQYINFKSELINHMNLLMSILTFKIHSLQHEFNKKLKILEEKREEIISAKETTEEKLLPLELLELNSLTRELEVSHHTRSKVYKQKKVELQLEYEDVIEKMDKFLDIMKSNFKMLFKEKERLERRKRQKEPIMASYLAKAALEGFGQIIKEFEEKQKKGWKTLFGDEQMLEILETRGLAVSKSGFILTEDGERLTYDEAEAKDLLKGLDFREQIYVPKAKMTEDFLLQEQLSEPSVKESLPSQPSSKDVIYLKETLGKPLTLALAEIVAKQPRDPIHYLGHWLFKYRYNQELEQQQNEQYEAIMNERNRLLKEKLHQLYEEEAKLIISEMIAKAHCESVKRELERILREQAAAEMEYTDDAIAQHEKLKEMIAMSDK